MKLRKMKLWPEPVPRNKNFLIFLISHRFLDFSCSRRGRKSFEQVSFTNVRFDEERGESYLQQKHWTLAYTDARFTCQWLDMVVNHALHVPLVFQRAEMISCSLIGLFRSASVHVHPILSFTSVDKCLQVRRLLGQYYIQLEWMR